MKKRIMTLMAGILLLLTACGFRLRSKFLLQNQHQDTKGIGTDGQTGFKKY